MGEGLRQVGFYTQPDAIKSFKWVPQLAQLVLLCYTSGGQMELRLVSSAGLSETLKAFAAASQSDELGRACAESRPQTPLESLVLVRGDEGETAALSLSPNDSDCLIDFDVTNSEIRRSTEPNTYEQTIDVMLYFETKIQFHQMTVTYKRTEREGSVSYVSTKRLWTKELSETTVAGEEREFKKIGKVLASRSITGKGSSDELVYAKSCVALKVLFLL